VRSMDHGVLTKQLEEGTLGTNSTELFLNKEPWVDMLVKSHCLKVVCDEVASTLTDMISVSSAELGNVLRKVRTSYSSAFSQLKESWDAMRSNFVCTERELFHSKEELAELKRKMLE